VAASVAIGTVPIDIIVPALQLPEWMQDVPSPRTSGSQ
jgi:hypothetical protein